MASPKKDENVSANENFLMKVDDSQNVSSDSDDTHSDQGDSRENWSRKAEYILSVIGYCVGLGNIWRFPYVCMRNGGGAFLIPFFIALFICALPVYFLEVSLGQFSGKSAWHSWSICPLFRGIGISMNILCFYLWWYYSMILAWCLVYLGNSFKSPLPWTQCGQSWNTENCVTPEGLPSVNMTALNTTIAITKSSVLLFNATDSPLLNESVLTTVYTEAAGNTSAGVVSSAEEFWLRNVLQLTSSIDDLGGLVWHNVVALIAANVVVLVGIIKGVRSVGKVVYITATLPYFLLAVILVMGCTLTGASDGIIFYIKPEFSKLLVLQTWVEAFIQVFYSLGPGWGGLVTMASYSKFKNNCFRDSIMLTLICEGTSIFGGFSIFSVLGHMAYIAQVPITEFAKSGAGLAFIVYPEAISYLPVPQLWGFLFFLMLFTLGLDSQFTNVETFLTTIIDIWPRFMRRWRSVLTIGAMAVVTVLALVFTSRGGMYVFQLMDWYIAAFTLFIQAALECVVISWIYGVDRFCYDISLMLGRRPPYVIVICWKYISPAVLMILFFLTSPSYEPPVVAGYAYPPSVQAIGWLIAVIPFSAVVGYAIIQLIKAEGSFKQRLLTTCTPTSDWGPNDVDARKKYDYDSKRVFILDCSLPCSRV